MIQPEIISGVAPLERELAGTRPRLYLAATELTELRRRVKHPGYVPLLAALNARSEAAAARGFVPAHAAAGRDLRGSGCDLANLAMSFLLTRRRRFLDATLQGMRTIAAYPSWISLGGHFAHGFGVAFDWLHDEIEPTERDALAEQLRHHCQAQFALYSGYSNYHSFCYTCNHLPVVLAGLTAGAGALYGLVPGPAAWLRLVQEKALLMRTALGPDGVSPEGVGYGQYYAEFLFKTLALLDGLLGVDLFSTCEWCRRYPEAMLYHAWPRRAWKPEAAFFQFGDSPGHHWYGPDPMLRRCAAVFRDGHAQWLADAVRADGIACDSAAFLNVLWHDPTVPPLPPRRLPRLRQFEDMGLAFLRSGWDGRESVLALRCGPPAGHHAHRVYRHNVAGGHMHPAAASIQLVAHGEPLLIHTGYTRKLTAHANTLLVNGAGQLGEGGEWFEDQEFRRGLAAPAMLRADDDGAFASVVADAAPAYPAAAGLRTFRRHAVFLRPACWVIADEVETEAPAAFELLFHTPALPAPDGAGGYLMRGHRACLRIVPLAPAAVVTRLGTQRILGIGIHADHEAFLLSLSPPRKTRRALFITVLHAFRSGAEPAFGARLIRNGPQPVLAIRQGRREVRLPLAKLLSPASA